MADRPTSSPDDNASGMLAQPVDALRYGGEMNAYIDPWETEGKLRPLVPDGARVLDIGCGTGSLASYVSRDRQLTIVGIEPDAARAAMARERGLEVVHAMATREVLEQQGLFDVVLLADVLEHVPAPQELLRIASERLKPGGRLVVSVPNVAHWSVRAALLAGKFDYSDFGIMDATHLRWFTQSNVRRLFEGVGLEIISVDATAGTWLPQYHGLPWKMIPGRIRRPLIRQLSKRLPRLFGCQHIVNARVRQSSGQPAA